MQAKPVHVASDVHLTPSSTDRARPFLQWLQWAATRSSRIVLNGDIFDFWFDYPHFVMKGYDPLLDALRRFANRALGSRSAPVVLFRRL